MHQELPKVPLAVFEDLTGNLYQTDLCCSKEVNHINEVEELHVLVVSVSTANYTQIFTPSKWYAAWIDVT